MAHLESTWRCGNCKWLNRRVYSLKNGAPIPGFCHECGTPEWVSVSPDDFEEMKKKYDELKQLRDRETRHKLERYFGPGMSELLDAERYGGARRGTKRPPKSAPREYKPTDADAIRLHGMGVIWAAD